MYILYFATSPILYKRCVGKLGMTEFPKERESNLQTATPPSLSPDCHYNSIQALWLTTATNREELFELEDRLHNAFLKYRLMDKVPGDSEWFDFQGNEPLPLVRAFLSQQPWIQKEIAREDVLSGPRECSRYLKKQSKRNTDFLKSSTAQRLALEVLQKPVIHAIRNFIVNQEQSAGYVISPCGSGKTVMGCKSIQGLKRVIICAPSHHIQYQWRKTLQAHAEFSSQTILELSSKGTTNIQTIRDFMKSDSFCLITTYASSHLLVDLLDSRVELVLLDEAHHLAGIVAKENEGEGKTRRLMLQASKLGIKRLSLTFTPRVIEADPELEINYLSMDNQAIFGTLLYEVKLRDMIVKGILPDYRVWVLRDEVKPNQSILAKASMIAEAWNAKQFLHGKESYMLNHLVVFAESLDVADEYTKKLVEMCSDTRIFCVKGGDPLSGPLRDFEAAQRAILVNCKVLGEGVDIPCADSVAITYPKHVKGAITQMILRAGRWYSGKSLFHVLLPMATEDDIGGFEHVLMALASVDGQILDEIVLKAATEEGEEEKPAPLVDVGDSAQRIMIEEYGSSLEEISKCFKTIRSRIYSGKSSREIQALCVKEGIRTSREYEYDLRARLPELPENPVPSAQTWYDFLHPSCAEKWTPQEFVALCQRERLMVSFRYDEWRAVQPSDQRERLPSAQNIADGYFGVGNTSFETLFTKFGTGVGGRRR